MRIQVGVHTGTTATPTVGSKTFTITGLSGLVNKSSLKTISRLRGDVRTFIVAPPVLGYSISLNAGVYTVDLTGLMADNFQAGDVVECVVEITDKQAAIESKVDLLQESVNILGETVIPDDTHPVYMGSTSGSFTAPFTGKIRSFEPALQCFVNDIEVLVGAQINAGDRVRLVVPVGSVGTHINFITQISSTLNFPVTAQRDANVVNTSDNLTGFQHVPFLGTMKALKGALVDFEDGFFSGAIGGETINSAVNFRYFCEDSSFIYFAGNSFIFRKNKITAEVNRLISAQTGNTYIACNDDYLIVTSSVSTNNRTTVVNKNTFTQLFSTAFGHTAINSQPGILAEGKLFAIAGSQYLHYYLLPDSTANAITSVIVTQIFLASDGFIYASYNNSPNIAKINTVGIPSVQATLAVFVGNAIVRHMEEYSGKVYCVAIGGGIRSFNLSDFTSDRQIATGLGILNFKIHNGYLYGVTATGTLYCIDLSTDLVVKTTINTFTNGGWICDIDRTNEMLAISNLGDLGYKIYKLEDLRIP